MVSVPLFHAQVYIAALGPSLAREKSESVANQGNLSWLKLKENEEKNPSHPL
jgi:hypothetical protein